MHRPLQTQRTMTRVTKKQLMTDFIIAVAVVVVTTVCSGLLYPLVARRDAVTDVLWAWPGTPPKTWPLAPRGSRHLFGDASFAESRYSLFSTSRHVEMLLVDDRKANEYKAERIEVGFPFRAAKLNIWVHGVGDYGNVTNTRIFSDTFLPPLLFTPVSGLPHRGSFIPTTIVWKGVILNVALVLFCIRIFRSAPNLIHAIRVGVQDDGSKCLNCGHLRPPFGLSKFDLSKCPECGHSLEPRSQHSYRDA